MSCRSCVSSPVLASDSSLASCSRFPILLLTLFTLIAFCCCVFLSSSVWSLAQCVTGHLTGRARTESNSDHFSSLTCTCTCACFLECVPETDGRGPVPDSASASAAASLGRRAPEVQEQANTVQMQVRVNGEQRTKVEHKAKIGLLIQGLFSSSLLRPHVALI